MTDMKFGIFLFFACLLGPSLYAASVCNPNDLQGPYGFQISGETTISGTSQSVTSLGRIVFDGQGKIAGTATVMFAGLLLGNPVTGSYESHTDCTASWILQDDSGAFQHFSGVVTPDGKRVAFRQTDAGAAQHGILAKASAECKAADIQKQYQFTLSGSSIAMEPGDAAATVDAKGTMEADANGDFTLTRQGKTSAKTQVSLKLDSDCGVQLEVALPNEDRDTTTLVTLRGILVDGGRQILAIRTDPGWMAAANFTAP